MHPFHSLPIVAALALCVSQSASVQDSQPSVAAVQARSAGTRGYLGVSLREADVDGRKELIVTAVAPGSPAQSCGLAAGDRVTRLDGAAVEGLADFTASVRKHAPGSEVSLAIERDLPVTLAARSDDDSGKVRLGVILESDADLRVDSVQAGTPAQQAGVQAGDRLLALGGQATPDGDRLRELVQAGSTGEQVRLRIGRELHARLAGLPGAAVQEPVAPGRPQESRRQPRALAVPVAPTPPTLPAAPGAPRGRKFQAQEVPAPEANPAPHAGAAGDADLHEALRGLHEELDGLRKELQELRKEIREMRRSTSGDR